MSRLTRNKRVKPFRPYNHEEVVEKSSKAYKVVLLQDGKRLAYNGQKTLTHVSFGPEGNPEKVFQTIVLNDDGSIYEQVKVDGREKYHTYYFIFADGKYASARTDGKDDLLEGFTVVEDAAGKFKEVHTSFLPVEENGITFEQIKEAILSFDVMDKGAQSGPSNS